MHDPTDLGESPLAGLDATIRDEDAAQARAERDLRQRTAPHGDALLAPHARSDTPPLRRLPGGDFDGEHRLPRA